jgi:succinate dehydrogenase/fumarate reductase flavoprotein subunit
MVDSANVSKILGLDDLGPEKPSLEDGPELFKEDILEIGEYLNNQRLVDTYVSEAPHQMKKLIERGLPIKSITSAHGSRYPRGVIVVAREMAFTLIKNVAKSPINLMEDIKILELLKRDGRCVGGVGIKTHTGEIVGIKSKAVIIATGGWQNAYQANSGSDELTGDGQAMAYRAGGELVDMEMVRFVTIHLIWPPIAKRDHFVLSWADKQILVNSEGEEILKDAPLDPEKRRVYSTRRIADEISSGLGGKHGGITLVNPEEGIRDAFIKMKSKLGDVSKTDTEFEVAVGCSYTCGGIKINEKMETTVPGLYAAGEVTGGMFGARRVASALTEAMVDGAVAARNAAKYVETTKDLDPETVQLKKIKEKLLAPLNREEGVKTVEIRRKIFDITAKALGLHRKEADLKWALEEITRIREEDIPRLWTSGTKSRNFNKEWFEGFSLENILTCIEASARSALMREESRGFHRRVDYPERDDEWLKNIVIKEKEGKMEASTRPVIVTTVPPRRG